MLNPNSESSERSPTTGEGAARPRKDLAAVSRGLSATDQILCQAVVKWFELPENCTGLVFAFSRGADYASRLPEPKSQALARRATVIADTMARRAGLTVEQDQAALQAGFGGRLGVGLLLGTPGGCLREKEEAAVADRVGALVCFCLTADRTLPRAAKRVLLNIVRGQNGARRPIELFLSHMTQLPRVVAAETNRNIKTLLAVLQSSLQYVARSELPTAFTAAPIADPKEDVAARADAEAAGYDFVAYKRLHEKTTTWVATSALLDGRYTLAQCEVKDTFAVISSALRLGSEAALQAFLITLTGLRPALFDLVALESGQGSAWLDLDSGLFWLSLSSLVKEARSASHSGLGGRRTEPQLAIPWPREVVEALRQRRALRRYARTLLQLIDPDTGRVERFIHSASLASRHITIERLARLLPRLAMTVTTDELYAAMLNFDPTVGSGSALHYCVLESKEPSRIVGATYALLGLSGEILSCGFPDTSLHAVPPDAQVAGFLVQGLERVNAVMALAPNEGAKKLCARISGVATDLGAVVNFGLGIRPKEHLDLAGCQLNTELAIATVSDKVTSAYHEVRLVALPTLLARYIDAYRRFLVSAAHRLADAHPELAVGLLEAAHPSSTLPLFVSIDEHFRPQPLSGRDIGRLVEAHGLAANESRSFTSRTLRDAGLGSAEEAIQLGRAQNGQEPFSPSSALVPQRVLAAIRKALDEKLRALALPLAHPFKGRHRPPPKRPSSAATVTTSAMDRPFASIDEVRAPFSKEDPWRLSQFMRARLAFERNPPTAPIEGLVASCILYCGISNGTEAISLVRAAHKQIWIPSTDVARIDYEVDRLGLRSTYLSCVALGYAQRLPEALPDDATIFAGLEQLATRLLGPGSRRPLAELCAAARARYSFILPCALSANASGAVLCRTLEAAAVVRRLHPLNCQRPLAIDLFVESPRQTIVSLLRGPELLQALRPVLECIRTACTGREHETTRRRRLLQELRSFQPDQFPFAAQLVLGVLLSLAEKGDKPATLLRYSYALIAFVAGVAPDVENDDDLAEVDWRTEARKELARFPLEAERYKRFEKSSPRRTALNHLLVTVGVRGLEGGGSALSAPRVAIDCPSAGEVQLAIELVGCSRAPAAVVQRATLLLRLRKANSLRTSEPHNLRHCDITSSGGGIAFLVRPNGGRFKSDAAERVLYFGGDPEIISTLATIEWIRRWPEAGNRPAMYLGMPRSLMSARS